MEKQNTKISETKEQTGEELLKEYYEQVKDESNDADKHGMGYYVESRSDGCC